MALHSNKLSINCLLQFQTRVRKDVTDRAEYECSFSVDVGIICFTFSEALLCQTFSLNCFCCVTAFTNATCSFNRHLLWDNENTGRASYNKWLYCMRSTLLSAFRSSCSGPFLTIDTLSENIWLFWYPKNIPSHWYCPGKDILHAFFTVPFMFRRISCEFIGFESL